MVSGEKGGEALACHGGESVGETGHEGTAPGLIEEGLNAEVASVRQEARSRATTMLNHVRPSNAFDWNWEVEMFGIIILMPSKTVISEHKNQPSSLNRFVMLH